MQTKNIPPATSDHWTCRNYKGDLSRPSIPFNANPVLNSGMVCLWVHGKKFIVSYCLQVEVFNNLKDAGESFDNCVAHEKQCENILK